MTNQGGFEPTIGEGGLQGNIHTINAPANTLEGAYNTNAFIDDISNCIGPLLALAIIVFCLKQIWGTTSTPPSQTENKGQRLTPTNSNNTQLNDNLHGTLLDDSRLYGSRLYGSLMM